MESPLQVDDPVALFRVHCPVCRRNVWAGLEEPSGTGDDVLADHDCSGPVNVLAESGVEPHPRRSLARGAVEKSPEPSSDPIAQSPVQATVRGYPAEAAPPLP